MRVVITGAASGIGLSVAELLAADGGAHQLLLADRDADGLAAAAAKIGAAAATCVVDLSDNDCGDVIVAAAIAHMGGIDAVVSNAGIIAAGALVDLTPVDFDRIYAVNTKANWALAKVRLCIITVNRITAGMTTACTMTTPPWHPVPFYAWCRLLSVKVPRGSLRWRLQWY